MTVEIKHINPVRAAADRLWGASLLSKIDPYDTHKVVTEYLSLVDHEDHRKAFYESVGIKGDELHEAELDHQRLKDTIWGLYQLLGEILLDDEKVPEDRLLQHMDCCCDVLNIPRTNHDQT